MRMDHLQATLQAAIEALTTAAPLEDLLTSAVYYPGAGFDGGVVKFLRLRHASFVYADYGVSMGQLNDAILRQGFLGYQLAHRAVLSTDILLDYAPPAAAGDRPPPYGVWYIFARKPTYQASHGPRYLSLLYVGAEGVAAYRSLFTLRELAPACLAVKDHGFGGNWTKFGATDGPLRATALSRGHNALPNWLAYYRRSAGRSPCWPDLYASEPADTDNGWALFQRRDGRPPAS